MPPRLNSNRVIAKLSSLLLVFLIGAVGVVGQDDELNNGSAGRNGEKQALPKSTIKGRVVYEDTEKPVRRAPILLVQLRTGGRSPDAVTDRSGRFVVKNVPAGRYFFFVNAPGIITPFAFVKLVDSGPPQSWTGNIKDYCTEVEVNGDDDVEVTVHARPGGVISGRVTYHDGDPAPDAQLTMLRREGKEMIPVIAGISAAGLAALHTDDRGIYRIAGLPPGEYVVSAAESHTASVPRKPQDGGLGEFFQSDALSASYYGGTEKLKDATVLKVEAGSEVSDINIVFPDLATHAIGGTVTAHLDGRVLPGAKIKISNRDQPAWFMQGSQDSSTDQQGQWSFPEVPDGTYTVKISPPYGIPEPRSESTEKRNPREAEAEGGGGEETQPKMRVFVAREVEVTVSGADVSGLAVELSEGASISGTVEMPKGITGTESPDDESPDAEPYAAVRWAYAGAQSIDLSNFMAAGGGTFTIEGLRPGRLFLSADVLRRGLPEKGFYVQSITLKGVDLMTRPLTILEGQAIEGVRVVVSANVARGDLRLLDVNGKPVPDRFVTIIRAESSRWVFPDAGVSGMTDANGVFSFSCSPGEYLVIVAKVNEPAGGGLEWIRARAETASPLKLQAGDNKGLTVTVVP